MKGYVLMGCDQNSTPPEPRIYGPRFLAVAQCGGTDRIFSLFQATPLAPQGRGEPLVYSWLGLYDRAGLIAYMSPRVVESRAIEGVWNIVKKLRLHMSCCCRTVYRSLAADAIIILL